MFALPLLLSAAAGVNAILGGEVRAVKISDTSYICAESCVHDGVFFAQRGYFCPEKEAVLVVSLKFPDFPIPDCTGATHREGFSERQPSSGEELPKCGIHKSVDNEPDLCFFYRDSGSGKVKKTIQWSDVEKELESSATSEGGGQGTPEENQPAAQKLPQQCVEIGRQVFSECRQKLRDHECYEQSRKAFEKCWGLP
ncbi:hypothetical protein NHJ6243_008965 [Beauveria neobassiana]